MESGIKGTWQCDAVSAMTRQPENAHSQPMVSGQRIALLSARARPQLGTSPGGHDLAIVASGRISSWSNVRPDLSIVSITAGGSGHRRRDRNAEACQDPGSLARGETRCEQSVVDLTRHGEAVKCGCGEIQPRIVRETVRGGIDVPLWRRDDAVMIGVHACHFSGIGIE